MKKTTYQKKLRDSFAPFRAEALKRYAADKPKKEAEKKLSDAKQLLKQDLILLKAINGQGSKREILTLRTRIRIHELTIKMVQINGS